MINLLQFDSYGIKNLVIKSSIALKWQLIMESQNSLFIHEIREKSYFKSNFSDKSLMSIESN